MEPVTGRSPLATAGALARVLAAASHPGPTVAVTALTALLAAGFGRGAGVGVLVTAAVLAGQLSIGWSNDLIDAGRDEVVARADKPVARGDLSIPLLRKAIGASLIACVVLSLLCGWRSGLVHLLLGVGSGWAYNLGLKRTVWSAVPYAVAFGTLPAVVSLAGPGGSWSAGWTVVAGALLGVGAHLLNALPDLADDAETGVDGLPQRLGAARVRLLAPLVLLAGAAVATLGPGPPAPLWAWAALVVCLGLAVLASRGRGRVPFVAAIGIALVVVAALVAR